MLPFLILMSGCGEAEAPRGDVQGLILVQEEPLPSGVIRFVPFSTESGLPEVTGTIKDGHYALSGLEAPVVGKNKVIIVAEEAMDPRWDDPLYFAQVEDQVHRSRRFKKQTVEVLADRTNEFNFSFK
ncbi:MAG: hypothetical protein MPJ24_11280 [Pirellulaceae bacterium]|nr:hypothetical protein [Pirellulaceae bacterium]